MSTQALGERVARAAQNHEGLVMTALPGLKLFRATTPYTARKSQAMMVTFATVLSGNKHVDFGDRSFTYKAGDFLFITGESRYQSKIEDASPSTPYLSLALALPPEEITEILLALVDAGIKPPDIVEETPAVVGRLERTMSHALIRLLDAAQDPVSCEVLAPLARKELIVHLLRSSSGALLHKAASSDDGRIRKAMQYLEAHVSERCTVEEVARHVAMSPSHFAHRFRAVARISPMQYLKHIRLQRARFLMLGQGLNVMEAADTVGYASISHFTRDFKGYFGSPPGAYIQQFRAS